MYRQNSQVAAELIRLPLPVTTPVSSIESTLFVWQFETRLKKFDSFAYFDLWLYVLVSY